MAAELFTALVQAVPRRCCTASAVVPTDPTPVAGLIDVKGTLYAQHGLAAVQVASTAAEPFLASARRVGRRCCTVSLAVRSAMERILRAVCSTYMVGSMAQPLRAHTLLPPSLSTKPGAFQISPSGIRIRSCVVDGVVADGQRRSKIWVFARWLVVDGREWLPSTATVWQPRAKRSGAVAVANTKSATVRQLRGHRAGASKPAALAR